MLQGFVTLGRAELLLSFFATALLMCAAGYLLAQLVAMIRKPVAPTPLTPKCVKPHCDDDVQMAQWLRRRDYTLITRELWQEKQDETARSRNKPTTFIPLHDKTIDPIDAAVVARVMNAFDRAAGRHRKAEGAE